MMKTFYPSTIALILSLSLATGLAGHGISLKNSINKTTIGDQLTIMTSHTPIQV